ncbi:tumor necrosis factor alpha-induced protein 2 [Tiliqua scincoides]|uniref:tumor necrosis factor alpha-induced protein 2 n=1 Tax=Tiliqua scincoides TaxID=71010 RepID=UPI00346256DC
MIKTMPLFLSSPPKESRSGSEASSKPSTSSESELDSLSLESSAEEAQATDRMKTQSNSQDPVLGCPLGCSVEINGMCSSALKPKKHKKGLWKMFPFADISFGKHKKVVTERASPKEELKPVTVDQIRELIKNRKFSEASRHLIAMEKDTYCDSGIKSEEERTRETEDLYEFLKQVLLGIIHSSITIASTKPELLQEAVETIQEQVKEDETFQASGKAGCSRPRNWKEEWRKTVQASVAERMKEPPFDKSKGLSTTAHCFLHMGKTMKSDLITVVQHIKHLYPQDFRVCSTYAKYYHHYFSGQLEAIAQFELGNKDTHLLLTWVQNFYPNEIRNHPVLVNELNESSLETLLPEEQVKKFEEQYLINEADSAKRLLANCLQAEVAKWSKGREPEKLGGHFHSELPIDAIQVIDGGRTRAKDIAPDLGSQMSTLLLDELFTFLQSYKKELEIFMKENKQRQHFEATIIANINNCFSFRTHTEKSTAKTSALDDIKEKIFATLNAIQSAGFDVLLQGLFLELQPLFKKFTQKKWLSCADIMDDIITTTSSHTTMFKALKDPFRQAIMEKIHLHLIQEYIARLMRKKVSLKSPDLQNNLAELIRKNASSLRTFCTANGSNAVWLDSVLPSLAEIIRLQDINAIMLEAGGLASKYPDISKKQLAAILYIKGNLSSSESRSILSVLDIRVNATLLPISLFATIRAS